MATGSGKTFTAISFIYRLIKFAGARRVLFLVDRGNLGRQTKKEFDQYVSPYNNYKFGEEYIVQHLQSNHARHHARASPSAPSSACTRMLKGRELAEEDDEAIRRRAGEPVQGRPSRSPTTRPSRSRPSTSSSPTKRTARIYNLWRQVLEYFDAYLIGLTATPNKQTFGFFNQNLVMEYGHEQAVADGVNVNYDVYRIRTEVTEAGGKVEAGYWRGAARHAPPAQGATGRLDEDFDYDPERARPQRADARPDPHRRAHLPRPLADRHLPQPHRAAQDPGLRQGRQPRRGHRARSCARSSASGNEFAQKITYRTTGDKPEDLIKAFRTSYYPRIAVTVDMIATGTDIKPVEIVVFMRAVKSRSFFEQMKGRGVRIINAARPARP